MRWDDCLQADQRARSQDRARLAVAHAWWSHTNCRRFCFASRKAARRTSGRGQYVVCLTFCSPQTLLEVDGWMLKPINFDRMRAILLGVRSGTDRRREMYRCVFNAAPQLCLMRLTDRGTGRRAVGLCEDRCDRRVDRPKANRISFTSSIDLCRQAQNICKRNYILFDCANYD
jgi:hypothetical protein